MNEEINWEDAPEGFDFYVSLSEDGERVESFVRRLGDTQFSLPNGYAVTRSWCELRGTITERPPQEEEPSLTDEDSTQGQLSHIGDLLHNLSCSMENEVHQDILGVMVTQLWQMSVLYRQTPEQKLRAKVWDVVAETDIRESDIDSITTDILEKFKLEEI